MLRSSSRTRLLPTRNPTRCLAGSTLEVLSSTNQPTFQTISIFEPFYQNLTSPVLENLISFFGVGGGVAVFAVASRFLASSAVVVSYRRENEELRRKEAFLRNQLDWRNYDYRKNEIFACFRNSKFFHENAKHPFYDKEETTDPKAKKMAQKFLNEDFFNPSGELRKNFDEENLQASYKGPLTIGKIILPNLYPIPLFIIGGYTMRQAAMTAESDLSGTCWMRDSSFLWIDSLATYDAGMSILAGASTFFAFRLASCGIRRRITTKQAYLKDCENIFFNPVGDIKLQFVKPKSRDFILDGLFLSHQLRAQPAQILSFGVASISGAGLILFQSYFSIPAVVSCYIFLYMFVRGATELALFHPFLRKLSNSEPAFDANSAKTRSLLKAATKVVNRPKIGESDDFLIDQFYREKYPFMLENARKYKYRVDLKEPLMYINVGPASNPPKSVEDDQFFDDSDFK